MTRPKYIHQIGDPWQYVSRRAPKKQMFVPVGKKRRGRRRRLRRSRAILRRLAVALGMVQEIADNAR